MGNHSTIQRLVGAGQLIGGLFGMAYGGKFGAGGGSGNMIGQGIANLQGKDTEDWWDRKGGFGEDVLSSFGLGTLHKNYDPTTPQNKYGTIGQGLGSLLGGYTSGAMSGGNGMSSFLGGGSGIGDASQWTYSMPTGGSGISGFAAPTGGSGFDWGSLLSLAMKSGVGGQGGGQGMGMFPNTTNPNSSGIGMDGMGPYQGGGGNILGSIFGSGGSGAGGLPIGGILNIGQLLGKGGIADSPRSRIRVINRGQPLPKGAVNHFPEFDSERTYIFPEDMSVRSPNYGGILQSLTENMAGGYGTPNQFPSQGGQGGAMEAIAPYLLAALRDRIVHQEYPYISPRAEDIRRRDLEAERAGMYDLGGNPMTPVY